MKILLATLMAGLLTLSAMAENVTLTNPEHRGKPFLSITNADSAILMGNPDENGNFETVMRGLHNRAQSICRFKGLGRVVTYTRGQVALNEYVEVRGNYADHVDYAYINPFKTPYGTGEAEGFSEVICRGHQKYRSRHRD